MGMDGFYIVFRNIAIHTTYNCFRFLFVFCTFGYHKQCAVVDFVDFSVVSLGQLISILLHLQLQNGTLLILCNAGYVYETFFDISTLEYPIFDILVLVYPHNYYGIMGGRHKNFKDWMHWSQDKRKTTRTEICMDSLQQILVKLLSCSLNLCVHISRNNKHSQVKYNTYYQVTAKFK